MSEKKRRTYTAEFKREAVDLVVKARIYECRSRQESGYPWRHVGAGGAGSSSKDRKMLFREVGISRKD